MMLTTDGKMFVFGVFGADGYECEHLEAIFADEREAEAYKQRLIENSDERGFHKWPTEDESLWFYGNAKYLSVRAIEIGRKVQP